MAWRGDLQACSRGDRGRGTIIGEATGVSARAIATSCLAVFAIGLLVVTGCSHHEPQTPMEKALSEFDHDHLDGAIAACSEVIAQNPENTAAYLLRGRAQYLAGRLDLAVADLTTAIELNPRDPEAYYQRANAYRALGKMDLKDEDNMTARKIDPNYSYPLSADPQLMLDPSVLYGDAPSESKKKTATSDDADDLDDAPPADAPPRRSVVEDMFGMPSDLPEQDRLAPYRNKPPETNDRGWAAPSDAEPLPGAKGGLAGPGQGVGNANGAKSAGGLGAADRNGPLPAAREGIAGGQDLPPPDKRPGQAAARGQQSMPEYRNLNPYGASSMRPTGMREPSAFADPRTGLPLGQGRAATVGSPYIAPNPYAPAGQMPGAGTMRPTGPSRPLFPPPPGNRYDGGRGYGN